MVHSDKIVKNSDSLIELLCAQCSDLEKLLVLAREETIATQDENFGGVLDIVSKRAELGFRLDKSQQQIAELREHLGANSTAALNKEVTKHVVEIADQILAQDQKTKLFLTAAREDAAIELANLEKSQRGANAYLREETRGLSYNRSF